MCPRRLRVVSLISLLHRSGVAIKFKISINSHGRKFERWLAEYYPVSTTFGITDIHKRQEWYIGGSVTEAVAIY